MYKVQRLSNISIWENTAGAMQCSIRIYLYPGDAVPKVKPQSIVSNDSASTRHIYYLKLSIFVLKTLSYSEALKRDQLQFHRNRD